MPIGWETHSSPEMSDRPQAIINTQVLKTCDLLVAVFWTRLGTPTGAATSGTVEEINEHLVAGKPAMIYFSSAPVRLDSVNNEQYDKLRRFKEELRKRGLIDEYDDLTSFREKLSRHLAHSVIRHFLSNGNEDEVERLPAEEPIPAVSEAARDLLLEAVHDPNGMIMRLVTHSGVSVKTNGRNFVEGADPRSAARWRAAVDDLNDCGFVEDRAGKGEIFFVTDEGYKVANRL